MRKAGVTLSLAKSFSFRKSVRFLGFILDEEGIKADPEHLMKIRDFPLPNSKQQLQAFLGVCGFYRRFSVRHANYVDPFRDLLRSEKQWIWTDSHICAFEALKQNFLNTVALNHFLMNVKFCLQTDASRAARPIR